jgi:hypothetical protein
MAVDLTKITAPGSGSNTWVLRAGGSTKDSDNLKYCLDQSTARRLSLHIDSTIQLEDDAGPFYLKQMVYTADFQGTLKGKGRDVPCLIAGDESGNPVDILSSALARQLGLHRMPNLIYFYGNPTGDGTKATVKNINFSAVPAADYRVAGTTVQGSDIEQRQVNLLAYLWINGVAGDKKAANLTSITGTAPNMHAHVFSGTFAAGDVGKHFYIENAPTSANNGKFIITAVTSANEIVYTNASGSAETTNCVCGIRPDVVKVGRRDLLVDNCHFESPLSTTFSTIDGLTNIVLPTVGQAIWAFDEVQMDVVGSSSIPAGCNAIHSKVEGEYLYATGRGVSPTNGIMSATNCTALNLEAFWMGAPISDLIAHPTTEAVMPSNAVRSKCILKNNITEWSGVTSNGFGGNAIVALGFCDYDIEDNTILQTKTTGGQAIPVVLVPNHAHFVGMIPGELLDTGDGGAPASAQCSMLIDGNSIEMPDTEFTQLLIFGGASDAGDPLTFLRDGVISHNTFIGDVYCGVFAGGLDGLKVKYNKFLGNPLNVMAGDADIQFFFADTNCTAANNQSRPNSKFHLVLHTTAHDCSCDDTNKPDDDDRACLDVSSTSVVTGRKQLRDDTKLPNTKGRMSADQKRRCKLS